MERPSYYAVIPADVRYDNKLTDKEKLLYGEITALSNAEGYCWASNEYFANLYGSSTRTIRSSITKLEENGYLKRQLIYKKNSKEVERRLLYPMTKISSPEEKNFPTPEEKNFPTPGEKNFLDNNTSSNITSTNNKEKEIYKEKESFCKPTIEEIDAYCRERNNSVDAEAFYYHYESKGWLVGKAKMKSWKAAVITWEKSSKSNPAPKKKKSSFFF